MGVISNHMGYMMDASLQQRQCQGILEQRGKQSEQSEMELLDKFSLLSCTRGSAARQEEEGEGR